MEKEFIRECAATIQKGILFYKRIPFMALSQPIKQMVPRMTMTSRLFHDYELR